MTEQCAKDFFTEDSFHSISNGLPTIYGVTSLTDVGCADSLIVAPMKGNIMSYSFKKSPPSLVNADCCEVIFKSLSTDTAFTGIDCLRYGMSSFAVAMIFSKEIANKQTYSLNIYNKICSDTNSFGLENMENYRSFDLGSYAPFQITHCQTRSRNAANEVLLPVFLLLGGDCQIHVYSYDEDVDDFAEAKLDDYFPEFKDLSCAAMWVDIKNTSGKKRISALGKTSGEVSLYITDYATVEWTITSHNIQCDSPVTCLRIFSKYSTSPKPHFLKKINSELESVSQEPFHLLVTCARESAVVYCFCGEQGFQFPVLLEQSADYDCVTCCEIADVNRDGKNNIIIGTYGHRVLVYPFDVPGAPNNPDLCPCCPTSVHAIWSKAVSFPVISVKFLDINGDGLKEMVVVSTNGVHVLHCDTDAAIEECLHKLEWLRKFGLS